MITKLAYFEDWRTCPQITTNLLARWYSGYANTITEIITAPAQYHVYIVPDGHENYYYIPALCRTAAKEGGVCGAISLEDFEAEPMFMILLLFIFLLKGVRAEITRI